MWLRRLLGAVYGLDDLSVDTPGAVRWDSLPAACALQLHWPPTKQLIEQLERTAFATVVLARHPLDVLVSILQFAQHEPRTARWLNGEGGTELPLLGADPSTEAFRHYATGPRARALLGITAAWWSSTRHVARVRFEELAADPHRVLSKLTSTVSDASSEQVRVAVDAVTFSTLQRETRNGHFWRGEPGHWRRLLTADLVEAIASAHRSAFDVLGYDVDADPTLTEARARENWRTLDGHETAKRRLAPRATRAEIESHLTPAADPSAFVDRAYELVLRREPDESGRRQAIERLRAGLVSPAALIAELATSREGRRVRAVDDGLAFATWARRENERPRGLHAPPELDEAAIGIPWVLSRYRGEANVLVVGHAFADAAQIAALIRLGARRLVGVDPAPTDVNGIESVVGDVRSLPFAGGEFEVVFCVGTLHHVGCDNRAYGLDAEADDAAAPKALQEIRRVLRRGGRAFVTVPCGEEQDLGMFVQHSYETWNRWFASAGFAVFEDEWYALEQDGWRAAERVESARYAERGDAASAVLCAELRPGRVRETLRSSIATARRPTVRRA